jgi:hypothetical protein
MKGDRLARFYEMSAALLFAMVGIIVFGYPEGSVATGSLVIWMFTFIHLNRRLGEILEELKHVREVPKVWADESSKFEEMPMVQLSRKEEGEEEWQE